MSTISIFLISTSLKACSTPTRIQYYSVKNYKKTVSTYPLLVAAFQSQQFCFSDRSGHFFESQLTVPFLQCQFLTSPWLKWIQKYLVSANIVSLTQRHFLKFFFQKQIFIPSHFLKGFHFLQLFLVSIDRELFKCFQLFC